MHQGRPKFARLAGRGLLAGLLVWGASAHGADSLNWRRDKDTVDADISSWSLVKTLEVIAEATGWHVYLEPGTQRDVSTTFKGRSADRALDLLLGNLGRALLPGTNGSAPRLLVFRTAQKDATQLIRAKKAAKPIPDELIVRMKKGKDVDELAKKLGAKVLGKSDKQNAGRLKFDSDEAAAAARESLKENEDVASVDPNFPIVAEPGLQGAGGNPLADLKLQPLKEGDPVIIGLIDTAVQKVGNNYDGFLLPGISVAGDTTLPSDKPTHGTSMFETIMKSIDAFSPDGSSTPVKVLSVDVYGNNGTTTTFEVGEGISRALEAGAQIINLSLGSDGNTPYLENIIQQGVDAGRTFVASAGNTPVATPVFPAAYPGVNAVTAGDSPNSIAPYANYGDFVDAMAPGSAVIGYGDQNWRVNGTSPAAAYFSGAVAVAVSGGQTPAQAAAAARKTFPVPPVRRTP
jgi:hypothetical protein